jgi:hypothetical protein
MTRGRSLARFFFLLLAVFALSPPAPCNAWEWEDYLGSNDDIAAFQTETLSMDEIRDMRVRDIKRRLSRTHGFSADELGRMLDKKELIQALSFEEHKEREKELEKVKRYVIVRGIIIALVAVVVVLGWPLWVQIYQVGSVNLVVYTDKKRHEASRCMELGSIEGMFGVLLMGIVDTLRIWLSLSIFLSWFMSSKFFFPTPNLSVRPADFMGEKVAKGPLSKYGLNVGPMALSWGFRFLMGRLEAYTGRALARAYQKQKKAAREWESPEERAARKAARKAAKKAAREDAENQTKEAEMQEAKRRKDTAAKATAELFPEQKQKLTKDAEDNVAAAVFPHMMKTENGEQQIDESEREFEQEMETVDMEDLD